jgi:hypothetical protein
MKTLSPCIVLYAPLLAQNPPGNEVAAIVTLGADGSRIAGIREKLSAMAAN